MEEKIKNRNGMIDVLRLVFAISVVMIHTEALKSISEEAWVATSLGFSRIAVPFFFVVSGYYFFGNSKNRKEPGKTLKRLGSLYIKWLVFEIVILLPGMIPFIKENPYNIVKAIFFTGVTGSLWYIVSLIYAIAITSYFFKKDKVILVLCIGLVLYLFGITGDVYGNIFNNKLIEGYKYFAAMPQSGITSSIFYVSIGAAIFKYNLVEMVKKPTALAVSSLGILLIEVFTVYYNKTALDYNMYISLVIVAPLVFIWALKSQAKIKESTMKLCREFSIGIYCSHQIFLVLIFILVPWLAQNTFVRFISTLILAGLFTALIRSFKFSRNLVK